jgi:transcriptional regulator with XRE-family HTH domain
MYPNLKWQLWLSGIRQNRLAKILGVDETILSKIVNGSRAPNAQMRERIASFLQSDPDWLFQPADVRVRSDQSSDQPAQQKKTQNGSA